MQHSVCETLTYVGSPRSHFSGQSCVVIISSIRAGITLHSITSSTTDGLVGNLDFMNTKKEMARDTIKRRKTKAISINSSKVEEI